MNKLLFIAVITAIAAPARAQADFESLNISAGDLMRAAAADTAVISPAVEGPAKLKIGQVSSAERKDYITRASLWRPEESLNVAALDFKVGPFEKNKYVPEELVTCSYVPMGQAYDGGKPNGTTRKFKCADQKGKEFKVKYGEDNGEIVTEVAASWILNAIGAYTDKMYPVRVTCPNCPSDPFKNESDPGAWPAARRVAIEEKLGERIENKPNSGIGFDEFNLISDRVGAEALSNSCPTPTIRPLTRPSPARKKTSWPAPTARPPAPNPWCTCRIWASASAGAASTTTSACTSTSGPRKGSGPSPKPASCT